MEDQEAGLGMGTKLHIDLLDGVMHEKLRQKQLCYNIGLKSFNNLGLSHINPHYHRKSGVSPIAREMMAF